MKGLMGQITSLMGWQIILAIGAFIAIMAGIFIIGELTGLIDFF